MTNLTKKVFSVIATAGLISQLVITAAPAFAADPGTTGTTLLISGNGSDSNSNVNLENNNNATVTQNNNAVVTNNVTSTSSTGGNDANKNTGGSTAIVTGNAKSVANVTTDVNANQATIDPCNCNNGDTKVAILGNGSDSLNNAELENNNKTNLNQNNNAVVVNNVDTAAKTGENDANKNTGGNVTVLTGDATAHANVATQANANVAQIGSGNGNGNNGSTQLIINGNGSASKNNIDLENENNTTLVQGNNAVVTNNVDADAFTGRNNADSNTGGDVKVFTGNANAAANVDNMLNFNAANIDNCGCGDNVIAKVAGNGSQSKNKIEAEFANDVKAWQGSGERGNDAVLVNDVNADAKTGLNDANKNTGTSNIADPVEVFTGDSTTNTTVTNNANANVFGTVPTIVWPNSSDLNFNFDFNFTGLFGQQG